VSNTLLSKIQGCLVAGAIGDTLGRPTEGWDYGRIAEEYGLLDDPFPRDASGAALVEDLGTDDTALARILCTAYLDKGGRVGPEDYARAWLEQMDLRQYWYCMTSTHELLSAGLPARMTGGMNIVSGAGLMSVNPVAIFHAGDPDAAFHDAVELTSMFQRGLSVLTAGVVAAGMAEALRPGASWESTIEAALRLAPTEPVTTFDTRPHDNLRDSLREAVELGRRYDDPYALREEANRTLTRHQSFDCEETMLLSFALFAAARGDVRAGIVGGANVGRDTDTIASIVGQLTGALNGMEGIPTEWREQALQLPGGRTLVSVGREMGELVLRTAKRDAETARCVLDLAAGGAC
jgi:ADP-ribosylglycohydrolase